MTTDLGVLERLFAIAQLVDEVGDGSSGHVDAVNEVADAIIHGTNPASRDAITAVLGLGLDALRAMTLDGHDVAGTTWTEQQMESGRNLVERLAGGQVYVG